MSEMCDNRSGRLESVIMFVVLILLITIVWWSRNYFTLLIDNMKDSRMQVKAERVSSCACLCMTNNVIADTYAETVSPCRLTNEASKCSTMIKPTMDSMGHKAGLSQDKIGQDNPLAIRDAYEALNIEFTSWLTVLGLVGGVFGLLIPLVSYLLQHHTLKTERDQLMSDWKELVKEYVSDISSKVDKLEKKIEGIDTKSRSVKDRFEKCERQNIRSQEFPLAVRINHVIGANRTDLDVELVEVANIVIGFDYLLESIVRWGEDVVIIRAKMHEWINTIDTMWRKMTDEQHEKVYKLLSVYFKPSPEFASRDDFLRILRAESEDFKWLEKFFRPFAPWKFN